GCSRALQEIRKDRAAPMSELREDVVLQLRDMARRGEPVSRMFKKLRNRLGTDIVSILDHMRAAFHLSLAEVKPVAALSRTDKREVLDEGLLEELMMPPIIQHRSEWDAPQGIVAQP